MGLMMKNFNIMEVLCKIQFLMVGSWKTNMLKMGEGLGQFTNVRRGLAKKGGGVFDGSLIPQSTLWWQKIFCQFFLKCLLKYFAQRFVDKILQKHLLCIGSELLQKVPTANYLVFFSEYISRIAILTRASVIRHQKCFASKKRFQ